MSTPIESFGSYVFNDSVMKERLSSEVYIELKKTIEDGESLNSNIADDVANAMKEWALEKGATHFTHWFQPMTGAAAGKHDAFINPTKDGKVEIDFSGKELIKGESDASSFPSGGLRVTFEARGYTAWDCTSPAFIKDNVLHIPTCFCSYTGEALDKKTPLLRSMEAISKQSVRVLRALGNRTVKKVVATCGAEQEYFLVDKEEYLARLDLRFTGRTLFGASSPKGQEMDDHYYGAMKERVLKFMQDVDSELWKLGVAAKTRHNEVAPSQFEIAPVFDTVNVASDHNQLTMQVLKTVANRHNFYCLLHEKPFKGINGSGKHNNWALSTDNGVNLLNPGKSPQENYQFLLFFSAVIKAVDKYSDLLRMAAANPGNDHRLGANEAPPAIISMFIGDDMLEILETIANGTELPKSQKREKLQVGVSTLPRLPKDTTDRNRTSPFAFTGNKFEFRMVPSSQSVSGSSFTINTMVADVLAEFAEELEHCDDIYETIFDIVGNIYKEHKRIIYNGNSYSDEWVEEATARGLSNRTNFVDALLPFTEEKNVSLFERHGVLTRLECESRRELLIEQYSKTINIEALTMIEMVRRQILPAVIGYQGVLASNIASIISLGVAGADEVQSAIFKNLSGLISDLYSKIGEFEQLHDKVSAIGETIPMAEAYRDEIIPAMEEIRTIVDTMETFVDEQYWPYPTYSDLLFETE